MKVPAKLCRFMLSSGSLLGTVYLSKKAGVWGTPEETSNLYGNLKNKLIKRNTSGNDDDDDVPKTTITNNISGILRDHYNDIVKKSFVVILNLPTHVEELMEIFENKFKILEEYALIKKDKLANISVQKNEADNAASSDTKYQALEIMNEIEDDEEAEKELPLLTTCL